MCAKCKQTFLLIFLKMDLIYYFIAFIVISFISTILYCFYKITWDVKIQTLVGKHVLVTGGSSGIGKSAAVLAAKMGAHVTIIARNMDKLNLAKSEIEVHLKNKAEQKITAVSCDVTQSYLAIENTITKLESEVGPIFMLINCAGSCECATLENASEENFRRMMNLNLMGTVLPTKAVSRGMKARGEGIVVVTASQAALLGLFGMSSYCASKWAIRGFAESIQQELMPYNISVTLCLPPDTDTPGFENENKDKPEETRQICQTGGLVSPDQVAQKMLSDAMEKRYWSTVGLDGVLLTLGCAGFSPLSSVCEVLLQVTMAGLVRIISIFHLRNIQSIVTSMHLLKTVEEELKKGK